MTVRSILRGHTFLFAGLLAAILLAGNIVELPAFVAVRNWDENLIGFGWTNGTFLALYHALPPEQQKMVLQGTGAAKAN